MTTSTEPPEVAAGSKARRIATVAAGYTLVAGGAVLLVLPGPGIPLMLAGLALLGREQAWARGLEVRIRTGAARVVRHVRPLHFGDVPDA